MAPTKRPAESDAQAARYQGEAQAWVEDYPDRAEALSASGGRWNLRKGGTLVAQYVVVRRGGTLVPERVPAAEMDVEDDPATLTRLAVEHDRRREQGGA